MLLLAGILLFGGCGISLFLFENGAFAPTGQPPTGNGAVDRPVQTTGCSKGAPIEPGTSTTETMQSGGISRTYLLHLPRGYTHTTRVAAVLIFHGSDPADPLLLTNLEQNTDFSHLADQEHFIAVYPLATEIHTRILFLNIGPSRMRWNTGSMDDPAVNDVLFISDLLNHLQATLCVDPQRIYATGFSSGGGMTGVLACLLAGRIAAFAPVSGSFFVTSAGCYPAHPVSLLEFHGTGDTKVPYTGSHAGGDVLPSLPQWLRDWATRDGCSSGPTPFFTRSDVTGEQWTKCKDGSAIVHYRIAGGGHAWPGSSMPGATQMIQATPLIWQFFQEHPLP